MKKENAEYKVTIDNWGNISEQIFTDEKQLIQGMFDIVEKSPGAIIKIEHPSKTDLMIDFATNEDWQTDLAAWFGREDL